MAFYVSRNELLDRLLEHINEAVALWLATAREFGDAVPEPKGERLILG